MRPGALGHSSPMEDSEHDGGVIDRSREGKSNEHQAEWIAYVETIVRVNGEARHEW